jgi:septin family protein
MHSKMSAYLIPLRYLRDESGLNRKNIVDNRVHCCFYFISPYGHGLKPLDVEVMKHLSNKVSQTSVIKLFAVVIYDFS